MTDDVDNDGDGFIDADDIGCENGLDDDEEDPITFCNDELDNDGPTDGLMKMIQTVKMLLQMSKYLSMKTTNVMMASIMMV